MYRLFFLVILLIISSSCGQKKEGNRGNQYYQSTSTTDFSITFTNDEVYQKFLEDSVIFGNSASVALTHIKGKDALEVRTIDEFSDAFINLERLFGYPIDFSKSHFVSMRILVPKKSWITALKFNFKDAQGNFGGCNEIANNFYGNYERWMDVVIDMRDVLPDFKNWHGEESPLPRTRFLSLNPYNAHQADSSGIYVHSIKLTAEKPKGNFTEALAPKPVMDFNNPHTITFDDKELTRKQMAIRAFESTYQAMADNIAGNKTMAIRLKGKESDKHLAFLPILDKLTGKPVDFTKVKCLKFSYYLTEGSADFDGAGLYLADEHWSSVLYGQTVFTDFKKGEWANAVIEMGNLDLELVRGEGPVLPNVFEIRLALNYRPNQKNIEMWLDDFGWE